MGKIEKVHGIEYSRPEVYLFQDTGVGVAEFAARTAYDSFSNSENKHIKILNDVLNYTEETGKDTVAQAELIRIETENINKIDDSELLKDLAWTYFHHSVLEHANLSYLIKGTSRGALQEQARHRIQGITVRSTRYTMAELINIFVALLTGFEDEEDGYYFFEREVLKLNSFVTTNEEYNKIEIQCIYQKLMFQFNSFLEDYQGDEYSFLAFLKKCVVKDAAEKAFVWYENSSGTPEELLEFLNSSKKKRNVGDAFKHVVTDNWKVDMVVTFNLRSLKNYFDLRDSGAAYFQIKWLAEEMKKVTPIKYLKLIDKNFKD